MEDKKQKVKILTFHWSNNYGALLQTFALEKIINTLGYDCSILDYINQAEKDNIALFHKSPKKIMADILFLYSHVKRNINSKKFRNKLHLSKKIDKEDVLVVGSDQIWNPLITGEDLTYFGIGLNSRKVISYAASMGQNLSSQNIEWFSGGYKNVETVSVREKTLKEFIEKNIKGTSKTVTVVLDPTLLIDKNTWWPIIKGKSFNINKPYLFVYTVDTGDNNFVQIVNKISNLLNLDVVCAGKSIHKNLRFNRIIKTFGNFGPEVFLHAIWNADFVVTSSFHGTSFALNFNKKFIAYLPRLNASRVKNLLELTNLENRIVISCSDVTNELLNSEIVYETVNEIMNFHRNESINWLKDALRLEN